MLVSRSKLARSSFNPGSCVACDTETTGLHPWHGDMIFAVSMCDWRGKTYYAEFPVDPFTRKPDYFAKYPQYCFIKSILENSYITKVYHNAKFDIRMFEMVGIYHQGNFEETYIAARLCYSDEMNYGLKPLAKRYLDIDYKDEKTLKDLVIKCRRKAKALGYKIANDVEADYWLPRVFDPEDITCQEYAVTDAERTMLLWQMYAPILKEYEVEDVYAMEKELFWLVYDMEERGVAIDRERCEWELEHNIQKKEEHRKELFRIAGREFDPINGAAKLAKMIYQEMGLPISKHTPAGNPSVDKFALAAIRDHPFVHHLLGYRSADKAIGSFFGKYMELALPDSLVENGWVLHPTFNQIGAKTNRFSSENPNVQQVWNPKSSSVGSDMINVRPVFGPRPGYVWYSFDYKQVEFRIFADVANEPFLLEAIHAGRDLHKECANKAWGGKGNPAAIEAAIIALELEKDEPSSDKIRLAWDELEENYFNLKDPSDRKQAAETWLSWFDYNITEAEESIDKENSRTRAKQINYCKIFGGGAKAAMLLLFVTYYEAKRFLGDYDLVFPGIPKYINDVGRQAAIDGYVINCYGRRLAVPETHTYKAANYIVQGSAADLIKRAMLGSQIVINKMGANAYQVLTVHDELVFEVKEENEQERIRNIPLVRALKDAMQAPAKGIFRVPIDVDCARIINSWDKKEDVKLE